MNAPIGNSVKILIMHNGYKSWSLDQLLLYLVTLIYVSLAQGSEGSFCDLVQLILSSLRQIQKYDKRACSLSYFFAQSNWVTFLVHIFYICSLTYIIRIHCTYICFRFSFLQVFVLFYDPLRSKKVCQNDAMCSGL